MSKLVKVGNSKGVVIPADFLKKFSNEDVEMIIEGNEVRLVFQKNLNTLIEEKRERNRKRMESTDWSFWLEP